MQDAQEFALFVLNQLSKEQPVDSKPPEQLKPFYPRPLRDVSADAAAAASGGAAAKGKAKGRGKKASGTAVAASGGGSGGSSSSSNSEVKQTWSRAHDFIHQQFGGALRNQVRAVLLLTSLL